MASQDADLERMSVNDLVAFTEALSEKISDREAFLDKRQEQLENAEAELEAAKASIPGFNSGNDVVPLRDLMYALKNKDALIAKGTALSRMATKWQEYCEILQSPEFVVESERLLNKGRSKMDILKYRKNSKGDKVLKTHQSELVDGIIVHFDQSLQDNADTFKNAHEAVNEKIKENTKITGLGANNDKKRTNDTQLTREGAKVQKLRDFNRQITPPVKAEPLTNANSGKKGVVAKEKASTNMTDKALSTKSSSSTPGAGHKAEQKKRDTSGGQASAAATPKPVSTQKLADLKSRPQPVPGANSKPSLQSKLRDPAALSKIRNNATSTPLSLSPSGQLPTFQHYPSGNRQGRFELSENSRTHDGNGSRESNRGQAPKRHDDAGKQGRPGHGTRRPGAGGR